MSPGPTLSHPTSSTDPDRARRGQFASAVAANQQLCEEHYRLILRLPDFPPTLPGQFIQIACRDLSVNYSPEIEIECTAEKPPRFGGLELMSPLAMLRRPFSLAGRRDTRQGVELEIIYRTIGVGTEWMAKLKTGQKVNVLGPLGNHFEPPPDNGPAILVGGGVGIPPMLYLASALAGRRAVAFCGALRRDLLPLTVTADANAPQSDSIEPLYNIDEFARHGVGAVICTDDGSYGFRGLVTQALELYLDRHCSQNSVGCASAQVGAGGTCAEAHPTPLHTLRIYTCGPEAMMKRVGEIAAARNIECQVAVERAMACGMGTCQSCCIRVRKPDPSQPPLAGQEWCYRLACTDGPIFRGADLLW